MGVDVLHSVLRLEVTLEHTVDVDADAELSEGVESEADDGAQANQKVRLIILPSALE